MEMESEVEWSDEWSVSRDGDVAVLVPREAVDRPLGHTVTCVVNVLIPSVRLVLHPEEFHLARVHTVCMVLHVR